MATLRGIEPYTTGNGKRYRVRWQSGDERKSKTFSLLKDAKAFHAQLRIAKETGDPQLKTTGSSKLTLAEFVKDVWSEKAKSRLAPKTYQVHTAIYNKHILRQLGPLSISSIDSEEIANWQDALVANGTGEAAIYRAMVILSSIFKEAARRSRSTGITQNPCSSLEKPKAKRTKQPKVFAPAVIERVRAELLTSRKSKDTRQDLQRRVRDATLVSLLAYAGLRPGELLALTTDQIGKKDLQITHTVSMGVRRDSVKSGQDRLVPIRPALRADLDALIAGYGLGPGDLLFANKDGDPWSETVWKNWRRRRYNLALERVAEADGIPDLVGVRPYELGRHSHSALLLASGISLARLAEQQGHSIAVLAKSYTQVLRDYEDASWIDPDQEIEKARAAAFGAKDPSLGLDLSKVQIPA